MITMIPAVDHKSVVLFYKYFVPSDASALYKYPEHFIQQLQEHQQRLCHQLELKGRVLLSVEGINGTVSAANHHVIKHYISCMEKFDLVKDCEAPHDYDGETTDQESCRLYANIDWKTSSIETVDGIREPFPDLKISVVKEIVSTGGSVTVSDIPAYGGKHLTPEQFHNVLTGKTESGEEDQDKKELVIIDVRNTFEYDIGHFVNPNTDEAAMNPKMVAFSSFDATFCAPNAPELQGKKVLMYCTGGIRCEKASCMLRKRGVEDVCQLEGGIHRYLDEYGDSGFFKGKNFVFDQRVALSPPSVSSQPSKGDIIVGNCVECAASYNEISGSRLCTVCRDLVLVCSECQSTLREYHCRRHSGWKRCYFTFLDIFDVDELEEQTRNLAAIRDALENKNVRRTLMKQITKVSTRITNLKSGDEVVNINDPKRCRTCMEEEGICNGLCWGFWKQIHSSPLEGGDNSKWRNDTVIPVKLGELVEPTARWNTMRYGKKSTVGGILKRGTVVEIKSWGSGGNEKDCVAVQWDDSEIKSSGKTHPMIYRWGVRALNGERMYDVQITSQVPL